MGKYHMTITEPQRCDSSHRNGHVTWESQVTVTACDKEVS